MDARGWTRRAFVGRAAAGAAALLLPFPLSADGFAALGEDDRVRLAGWLRTLRAEVEEEQQMLRELLAKIDAGESRVKQAAAWLTERVSMGKFALAARSHPALATLQGLESIVLGLEGKLSLYRALAEIEQRDPRLSGYPFLALEARTIIQQSMVEHERLAAARAAFDPAQATEAR